METLTFKQKFLIGSFLTSILDNSEKLFDNSNMNYLKPDSDQVICFDDKQKESFIRFIQTVNDNFKQ
jgi:hypothetical protein